MKGLGHQRVKRLREQYKIGDGSSVGLMTFKAKPSDVDENRDITVLATTDEVDLANEVVVPQGCDMTVYRRNAANFVDHNYAFGFAVGTLRWITEYPSVKNHRAWRNRSHIVSGLKNPLAEDVLRFAKVAGISCSIGFEMMDGSPPTDTDPERYQVAEWIIRSCSIIELSFTAMPMNVGCRSLDETELGDQEKSLTELDRLVTKGRGGGGIALDSAVALGFPYRKTVAVSTPKRLMWAGDIVPRRSRYLP